MKCLGAPKVFSAQNVAATGFVDFPIPFGGSGVILYIVTTDPQGGPSFTFNLAALNPGGTATSIITSPAVSTTTTTKLGAVPGATPAANVMANDILPGSARLTYTVGSGSFDIDVYAASFG